MAKISVRHSVAQAYGLLFGRPLTVIGLTWLPAVFYAEGASFLIHHINAAMTLAVPSSNGLLGQYAFFHFAALVAATALFGAVIAVPLTRQAFGLREEKVAVHLVIGPREFRLWFALLRYYAIVVSAVVVLAVCAGVAISQGARFAGAHGVAAQWLGLPLETWLNSVAGAFATIVFTAFAVRYGFLLDAIASAEDHARLTRASTLSQGNFWSIATILFVIAVPAGVLLIACEMTFGGFVIAGQGFAPADAASFAGILTVGLIVLHTLAAGASAGAYSQMAEAAAQEPEPEEASFSPVHQPRAVFARSADAPASVAFQSAAPAAPEPLPMPAMMEIATPEAESAPMVAPGFPGQWMAPPQEARSGADAHDTQADDTPVAGVQTGEAEPTEVARFAQSDATAMNVQPAEAPTDTSTESSPEVPASTEEESVAHVKEAQEAVSEDAAAPQETSDETPETSAQTVHPDVADAAAEADDAAADHAHDAEFPPPPLDPAGAISIHTGFHTPG
jgi:hypothetical protein